MNDINTCIQMHDGQYLDLLNPDPAVISINGIAFALSQLCRYGGHCRVFYSVAEHSVHCCNLVEPEYKKQALLHDAAEAFVGDIVWPVKRLVPAFQDIEHRILKVILSKYKMDSPIWPVVKQADREMLAAERLELLEETKLPWPVIEGIEPAKVEFRFYDPIDAWLAFLDKAEEVGLDINS